MREIWPDSFVEEGNLTQNISVLRKVLNGDGHSIHSNRASARYRFTLDMFRRRWTRALC